MSNVIEEGAPVISIRTNGRKATYRDLAENIDKIEKLGKWIAQAKFFSCDNEAQGCIIAADCFLTGMTLIEYQRRNKIVAGRPFKQYDAMLAEFHERGGKSRILQSTPDAAEIEFEFQGKKQTVSLTWQELQKEPTPYAVSEKECLVIFAKGETPPLKAKYATPRSRQTMLLARLISASLRVICPEVNYGVYTEEETDDIIDAEYVQEPAKVETKRRAIEAKTEPAITVEPAKEPARVPLFAPVNDAGLQRIRQLMAECYDAGQTDIQERIKAKLAASGMSKLADLTMAEADALIAALTERNANLWCNSSLAGHGSKNPE